MPQSCSKPGQRLVEPINKQPGKLLEWPALEKHMLYFDSSWRFASPAVMPAEIVEDILAKVIAPAPFDGRRQDLLETFKRRFAHAQGQTASRSSSESWAESDLRSYMQDAAENAPMFVEALYDALMDIYGRNARLGNPPWGHVNSVIAESGYVIQPPNLVVGRVALPVQVPPNMPSLDAEANELVQRSLAESESLLNSGKYRLAVQEILWLLETVSTAFSGSEHGDGTVTAKYFNRIIADLKRFNRDRVLSTAMGWMETLHAYLSSPSKGGIRHGTVLTDPTELTESEARLFCNLTRSYLNYLLDEHHRLESLRH